MRILYFNCQAGISGDMIVGSLLNFLKKGFLIKELDKLKLSNYKIKIRRADKKGVKAIKFDVIAGKETKHRNLEDIHKIINKSGLNKEIKSLSKRIFLNLAKTEAKVHKTTIDQVHFHEVGAIDSIIDIVAASILINRLRIKNIYSSRISVGKGTIKCQHGVMKLPVPAVKELLKGIPTRILNINKELTTPTGAAIIRTIADDFVDDINIKIHKKGYGAGTRDLKIPNVLEAIIGEVKMEKEKIMTLETNIDDMNPEFYEYIIEKLIKEGANEAFIQPLIMKKNRIGTLLTVICAESLKDKMANIIFDETTTFGIRINNISRIKLEREIKKIKTKYGVVNVKIGKYKGKIRSITPEYEDCKRIAKKRNTPIRMVYDNTKKLF